MKSALVSISFLFLSTIAFTTTITVPDDYPAIQRAIDAAVNGDTVLVHPGTYTENINFKGKAITVRSSSGAGITVIDGSKAASVVRCQGGEKEDSIIDGFTITNGQANYGGGMYNDKSSPTVRNCFFSGNVGLFGGGGMYNAYNKPLITNCFFSGNSVEISYGSPGGGMYNLGSNLRVTNCNFIGNSAVVGGGIFNIGNAGPVTNCILWNDTPDEIFNYQGTSVATFSCVQGGYPGMGNIDVDPLFVVPGYWHDNGTPHKSDDFWVDGDYHLTYSSPCKDSGRSSAAKDLIDFEGDPRIAYGPVDMGADEFYTHLYWTGDATPNGKVDLKFVGLPGTTSVQLWLGSGVMNPPMHSKYGDWWLQFPLLAEVVGLGVIPSSGVLVFPFTFPANTPTPLTLPFQSGIGMELTNLSLLEVD